MFSRFLTRVLLFCFIFDTFSSFFVFAEEEISGELPQIIDVSQGEENSQSNISLSQENNSEFGDSSGENPVENPENNSGEIPEESAEVETFIPQNSESSENTAAGEIIGGELSLSGANILSHSGNTLSGETVTLSGEVIFSSGSIGDMGIHTETQNPPPIEEFVFYPFPDFSLQQPSYVTASGSDILICDSSKPECKINFDFRKSFTGTVLEKNYLCHIEYGFTGALSESQKCNPNTIIFPMGKTDISIKIQDKKDVSKIYERSIQIWNRFSPDETLASAAGSQNTNSQSLSGEYLQTNTGENISSIPISTPQIQYALQIPSYVSETGENTIKCDPSKTECKINFSFLPTFSGSFLEKDYTCEIDFGFGFPTGEEKKCNPATVFVPIGAFEMKMKMMHKIYPDQTYEKVYRITNIGYAPSQVIKENRITLSQIRIGVQAGLSGKGKYFYCEKIDCKINLEYLPKSSLERCKWDFGAGIASSDSTHTRCNPGYVSFGTGIHDLSLRVYEKDVEDTNFKIFKFYVYNEGTLIKNAEKNILQEEISEFSEENQFLSDEKNQYKIFLQGKIGKEKTFSSGALDCQKKDRCYLNFTLSGGSIPKHFQTLWYVDSLLVSEKANPSGIWFQEGKHDIKLELFSGTSLVYQEMMDISVGISSSPAQDEIFLKNPQNAGKKIFSFGKILPNPQGKDSKEFIEIINTSSSDENLRGCVVKDRSRKYIFLDDVLLAPKASWYLFQMQSHISLGNKGEKISLECDTTLQDSLQYEREMQDQELVSGEYFPLWSIEDAKSHMNTEIFQSFLDESTTFSIRVLKRDGIKFSGKALPNADLVIESKTQKFLVHASADGTYVFKTKSIPAGEHTFSLFYTSLGDKTFFSKQKNISLSEAERLGWLSKKRKASSRTISSSKLLVSREYISDISNASDTSQTLGKKIFYSCLMVLLFSIILGHIYFLQLGKRNIFQSLVLQSKTRIRVIQILS